MIHNLAVKWAQKLVDKGADPENLEVLAYGIEGVLSEVLADAIAFAIAFIIGMPLQMLIWQIFWLVLRVNLGGFHANSHLVCLIYSTILAVGSVLVLPFIEAWAWLLPIEIGLTLVVAFFFAPYIHPNRPISDAYKAKVRTRGKIVATVESALIVLFYFVCPPWVAQIAGLGMVIATVLCIIGFAAHRFQKKENTTAEE